MQNQDDKIELKVHFYTALIGILAIMNITISAGVISSLRSDLIDFFTVTGLILAMILVIIKLYLGVTILDKIEEIQ